MHPKTSSPEDISVSAAASGPASETAGKMSSSSSSSSSSPSPETGTAGASTPGDGTAGGPSSSSSSSNKREMHRVNAYNATKQLLEGKTSSIGSTVADGAGRSGDSGSSSSSRNSTEFLVPFTSIVSLRNVVTDPPVIDPTLGAAAAAAASPSGMSSRAVASSLLLGSRGIADSEIFDLEGIIQQHPLSRAAAAAAAAAAVTATGGGVRGGVLRHPGLAAHHLHIINNNNNNNNIGSNGSSNTVGMAVPSLLTPNRGHHALFRALEDFESLEKQEVNVQLKTTLTKSLTEVVTNKTSYYTSSKHAVEDLEALSKSVPRRVCQHPFKKNDIVWVCRTCQADETCVLCHACFKASNHEGHDVAFYHAQAGGCCDCGDPDAWNPAGFCPNHGPASSAQRVVIDDDMEEESVDGKPRGPLNGAVIARVEGVVPAAVDWLVEKVASVAEQGHARTEEESDELSPPPPQQQQRPVDASVENDDESLTDMDVDDVTSTFSPSAAGSSRLRREIPSPATAEFKVPATTSEVSSQTIEVPFSKAERLGMKAREGGGLYLVLKSDDIHTSQPLVEAFRELLGRGSLFTESILQKCVRALKQFGQLVVWGTMELLAEMTATQIQLWLDGDRIASGVLGSAMLRRARLLTSRGLFCAILTRDELLLEQEAVIVLQWLTSLARSCDPLCQTVAEAISPRDHLVPLLKADFKLSSRITKYWHSLLLTLLAVPTFKSHLAAAYCDTYQDVTAEYARGMGVLERSGYALSVQFLNRVTYVVDLVQRRNLLGKLGGSLYQTLNVAGDDIQLGGRVARRLNPNHFVLTHRRYSPCISDLKCVLNVKGMPRLFASSYGTFLTDWIASLSLGQMMDPQIWRHWEQGHVELEVRGWVGAFNASISLGSLFERLLSWDDSDPSPIQDPNSPLASNLMTCVGLTLHMMEGLNAWQKMEIESYEPTAFSTSIEPYKRRSASLPFSTVSAKAGSVLAFQALPLSQESPFSFHIPLHRFVTACLRESCLRESGVENLRREIASKMTEPSMQDLFLGLMEFPLLVLSRAAQVRAGLWRRNGNGLNDQVLNYAEPPFCRAMRDADLLLVQFAVLGRTSNQTSDHRPDSDVGVCFLVHLLLHRLGLFDFCGFARAPETDVNRYLDEVQKGLYSPEKGSDDMDEAFGLPTTFSPATDGASHLLLLEEFFHIIITLCSELPPLPPRNRGDHVEQAKWRLKREVIHRLASGPKTHSELAEVHHVLSHWDNVYLSEEGKLVNPDDATGAALGAVLSEVAIRRISRGKMEPDKWELNREAWELYDPSFFHINLRSHQTAAEYRPNQPADSKYKVKPKPLCPTPTKAHPVFARLRRDITADRTLLATVYRTLHTHIRDTRKKNRKSGLRGHMAYDDEGLSETALARAVHLLSIGAFAWEEAMSSDQDWRQKGGGSVGSLFFDRSDDEPAPTAKEWIAGAFLANPRTQQSSEWYEGEETCLQLLLRLSVDGGYEGCFLAQDRAVQSGAAWLCEFASKYNTEASKIVRANDVTAESDMNDTKQETDTEKRKRIAKEKAMERMKAQAAKFASVMQDELGDNNEYEDASTHENMPIRSTKPTGEFTRQGSFASGSSVASMSDNEKVTLLEAPDTPMGDPDPVTLIPPRLMKSRPRCIICNEDTVPDSKPSARDAEGHRKSRRKTTNALAFVGHTQASTVMKGGGGPPVFSAFATVTRFVGGHVSLCGHAIHSDCWESYLQTLSHREDRIIGKRDEFRCPLCQRLSNCLVPFIDVGEDWIEPAAKSESSSMGISAGKSEDANDNMSIESLPDCAMGPLSLAKFLTITPWWVAKYNDDVVWDGQCAFVSNPVLNEHEETENQKEETTETSDSLPLAKSPRRVSIRPLRKKDLYAAWNAMMKTPRLVKRKLRPKTEDLHDDNPTRHFLGEENLGVTTSSSSSESAGETVVWRRFMDQVSDITYRSDGKRLGDENLHSDFGEFRHYIVEKYTYNIANRFAGRDPADWPSCVYNTALSDTQRQELSREKLLSKLMMSVQAFTYSVCCESNEACRLLRLVRMASEDDRAGFRSGGEQTFESVCSQFGISSVLCDGKLVLMPTPNSSLDDGCQPFNGKLGRLRYLALAVMAAAGAVSSDLVQLVLALPVSPSAVGIKQPYRAPVVFPILHGHVMTHVVAAICAAAGRARARSDSLDFEWPISFSRQGSFVASEDQSCMRQDSVVDDSEGFVKLGLLARVLQILLGKLDLEGLVDASGRVMETSAIRTLAKARERLSAETETNIETEWKLTCLSLVLVAVGRSKSADGVGDKDTVSPEVEAAILDRLQSGCIIAAEAACVYLATMGVVLQLVIPGIMSRYPTTDFEGIATSVHDASIRDTLSTIAKLEELFRIEPILQMLDSPYVQEIISNWYESARIHAQTAKLPGIAISGSGTGVCSRLYQTQGFRVYDWPLESCHDIAVQNASIEPMATQSDTQQNADGTAQEQDAVVKSAAGSMDVDTSTPPSACTSSLPRPVLAGPSVVNFSSKKCVDLIGGFMMDVSTKNNNGRPRVTMIPTSYTDLYAELGNLLPECDQSAVCLICGEVLNAGGKGECTKHSYKCGAGSGLFFLLQECAGLIMHNGKAAYIHSPYVDSHGETPQYRGRPLNLDLDRYEHLHEVWSGHVIRQQVLAERGSSRSVIVPDYY